MEIEVIFSDNLDQVLDSLSSALARALASVGATIHQDAVENSPVRTGALRQSWIVEVNEAEKSVTVGVPMDALDRNYAKFVENGTSKQPARHMLRSAVTDNLSAFPGLVSVEFQNA